MSSAPLGLWARLRRWWTPSASGARRRAEPPGIPDTLWQDVWASHGFLHGLSEAEQQRLRQHCAQFLHQKEFYGAHGLVVDDRMALAVAQQACLPLLHLGPAQPEPVQAWYGDFVGIVLHPGPALARREHTDDDGVVHEWHEELAGEAMHGGPVMLSWPDVADAQHSAEQGYNVVIHEFLHKMDLADGEADGCPPLPAGFRGHASARAARAAWFEVLTPAWEDFREQVIRAERFGQAEPWLDPYAAEALDEFYAVAGEAYFVNRARFAEAFPTVLQLYDAFFRRQAIPDHRA